MASGTNCASAMALAIDNFKLEAQLPEIPTAKHYIYAIDKTGYDALGLYAWGDGELFGTWPGETWVDEVTIGSDTYKVFLLDAESGNYNLIFNNMNQGKQLPNFAITANRDYYVRLTDKVEEVTPTGINTIAVDKAADNTVYDLQGRKIGFLSSTLTASLPKGIYIVNGKKIINR